MSFSFPKTLLASLLAATLLGALIGMTNLQPLPHTGDATALALKGTATLPSLEKFVSSVKNGQKNMVVGIYVPGVLALPVGQQPQGNAGYVTRQPNQATQFNLASNYGTVGILAHDDLAGSQFANILLDQYAIVVYGDGHEDYYLVNEIQKYQALSPTSTFSDFINLDGTHERVSASQLFGRVYGKGHRLVLQTCIDAYGDASWGRLFIIGEPATTQVMSVLEQTSFLLEFASFGLAYR